MSNSSQLTRFSLLFGNVRAGKGPFRLLVEASVLQLPRKKDGILTPAARLYVQQKVE